MKRWYRSARIAALAVTLGLAASTARAERWGDQGVGIMVGNPTGLSYKIFLDERIGIDAAFGVDDEELDTHVDLLVHDFDLLRRSPAFAGLTRDADVPVYFGVGPRLYFGNDTEIGLRLPIGVSVFPHRTPWEFFGEIAPIVRLSPSTGINFDFSLGVRYYIPAIRPRSR